MNHIKCTAVGRGQRIAGDIRRIGQKLAAAVRTAIGHAIVTTPSGISWRTTLLILWRHWPRRQVRRLIERLFVHQQGTPAQRDGGGVAFTKTLAGQGQRGENAPF